MARDLRQDAQLIVRAAIAGCDPEILVRDALMPSGDGHGVEAGGQTYDLDSFQKIFVIGVGKAAASMARGAEQALGARLTAGLVCVKDGYSVNGLNRIEVLEAAHPVPDERGAEATQRLLEIARSAGENDLVIFLVSGGGSSLLSLPAGSLPLADLRQLTESLLKSGATIGEVNTVRKHLFAATGGRMAEAASPARLLSLIVSDVIGDRLDVIASGPTVPDSSSFADALDVLHKYGLESSAAQAVLSHLRSGLLGEVLETPKPGDIIFQNVNNVILASNRTALDAAEAEAVRLGFNVLSLTALLEGDAGSVAGVFAAMACDEELNAKPLPLPACLLAGGETTLTVTGPGRGGRAQEFSLTAALLIENLNRSLIFAAGTDGTDGPTDAAGAMALGDTTARARSMGLDPARSLADNDSNSFFRQVGDLIVTGPTLTNVNDIYGVLVA